MESASSAAAKPKQKSPPEPRRIERLDETVVNRIAAGEVRGHCELKHSRMNMRDLDMTIPAD